jgi:hypothetical protein
MKKVIRLTESELTRLIKRVVSEQMEGDPDPITNENGGDKDWWSLVLKPKLKSAGFVEKVKPSQPNTPCYYKCCNYMFKGTHEQGTNVFLDCGNKGSGIWKLKVYNKGGQNMRSFDANENGADQAVKYALSLS